jgi:hypothetical protein
MRRVLSCVDSDEGAGLLHDLGLETLGLQPSPTFVPHVLFNQVQFISKQTKLIKISRSRFVIYSYVIYFLVEFF